MAWTKKLSQLNDTLGELVPNSNSIERFLRAAGIRQQMVSFNGTAMDIWSSAISEADKNGKVKSLIEAVLAQYPENPFLLTALESQDVHYAISPDIDEVSEWKGIATDTLEILTNEVSTLLPIAFLEKGILISNAIAKIEIDRGNFIDVGTGFVFRLEGRHISYFMTNYHVLPDRNLIPKVKIIFNYQTGIDGETKVTKTFKINMSGPFVQSPQKDLDICVVRLDDPKDELTQFGFVELQKNPVDKNAFVNIIQHPGGQMKQISLYHNIVTHTTDRIVQYLTDTARGSSGAPVFNSNWEIVAVHHSGGPKRKDEPELPHGFKSRNEGIAVGPIIDFIEKSLNNG